MMHFGFFFLGHMQFKPISKSQFEGKLQHAASAAILFPRRLVETTANSYGYNGAAHSTSISPHLSQYPLSTVELSCVPLMPPIIQFKRNFLNYLTIALLLQTSPKLLPYMVD
jgi:hypothetical protein